MNALVLYHVHPVMDGVIHTVGIPIGVMDGITIGTHGIAKLTVV